MKVLGIISEGIRMGDSSQIHSGSGDNVGGDKYSFNLVVSMDVGRLTEILQNNEDKIKELLCRIEKKNTELEIEVDERAVAIDIKNNKNDLKEFYEKFIKEHEGKLLALDKFFKDNDCMDKIEDAAHNLKIYIYSKGNRKTDKLDPSIFNELIQGHSKAVVNSEDKDIIVLLLFYLYRFCYIGDK